jgi:hypothetical protein
MKTFVRLLLLLAAQTAIAGPFVASDIEKMRNAKAPTNYIKNSAGEKANFYGITDASGIVTRSSSSPLDEATSFIVNATATSQLAIWQARDFENGVLGQTCTAEFKYSGDGTLYTAYVTLAGVTVSSVATLQNISSGSTRAIIYFPCGLSATDDPAIVIASTGDGAALKVDALFLGEYTGTVGAFNITPWTPYTPTFTGFGTATSVNMWWRRVGDAIQIRGDFLPGTCTAVEARVSLPNNYIASVVGGANVQSLGVLGYGESASATRFQLQGLYEQSQGYITFGIRTASTIEFTKVNGNAGFSSGVRVAIPVLTIPVQGIGVEYAQRTDQAAASWSGYHDSTCSWARTNTAYGDPTADASCALTQRQNNNFPAVTTVSGALPGIQWTAAKSGNALVCAYANASPNVSALAAAIGVQLTNVGGTQLIESVQSGLVSTNYQAFSNCAIIPTSAGSLATVKIQTKASAGQITVGGNAGSAVEWTVLDVSQPLPQPFVAGADFSEYAGVSKSIYADLNCDAASAITSQSGGISAIGNRSTASCALTIAGGVFSATPWSCQVTTKGATSQATACSCASATACTIYGASADYDAYVTIKGVR